MKTSTNHFFNIQEKMNYQINRGKTCIVSGCNYKARKKGLCNMCYLERRRNMIKICRCIYCGREFLTEESLKDHMIKFGTHV